MTNITILNSVTNIGNAAFGQISSRKITIPNSVVSASKMMRFSDRASLTDVMFPVQPLSASTGDFFTAKIIQFNIIIPNQCHRHCWGTGVLQLHRID